MGPEAVFHPNDDNADNDNGDDYNDGDNAENDGGGDVKDNDDDDGDNADNDDDNDDDVVMIRIMIMTEVVMLIL